jgi:hypothetical protein
MQTSLDPWVKTVLSQYTFRVLGFVPIADSTRQASCVIETDKGTKCIHTYHDEQELRLDYAVAEYMAGRGFRRIPRMIRNKYGDPFVLCENAWYACTDEVEGRPLRFSPEDVLPLARDLAWIHEAIQGFPLEQGRDRYPVTWKTMMLRAVQDWKQTLEEWQRGTVRDGFQTQVLTNETWMNDHMRRVTRAFGSQPEPKSARCLGEVRLEQFVMGTNNRLYMTTWPRPYPDSPLYDLAKLCLSALDQGYPEAVPDILREYQTIRALSDLEREQIRTYLLFPHTNWKLLYLYQRRRAPSGQLQALFQSERERSDLRESWIQRCLPTFH